jgi:hypothetical protein
LLKRLKTFPIKGRRIARYAHTPLSDSLAAPISASLPIGVVLPVSVSLVSATSQQSSIKSARVVHELGAVDWQFLCRKEFARLSIYMQGNVASRRIAVAVNDTFEV